MRLRNIGFIFWLVVFGSFRHCSSNNEDGKNRQTFVIRYKDGEQTIPVTVVLDYKKQTEYVINMNPRTPAKSVTLYDFKQRTIAYKDLTNRECFLGRLTHETLNEEINALQDVKNPVEGKPKMRSLDPRRPALTPTEIRNIAGQKTAVFCRKMNTWLLMPERVHGISKREAEEYEERTYQTHGHRSSQYSHYERETRRRSRNRSQADTRRRSQRNKSAAENESRRLEVSEPSLYLGHLNSQSSGSNSFNPGNLNNVPDIGEHNHSVSSLVPQKPLSPSRRNFESNKENANSEFSFPNNVPSSRAHSNTNNFGYPNYGPNFSNRSPSYSRPSLTASSYFNSNDTSDTSLLDHEMVPDAPKNPSRYFERNKPVAEIISESTQSPADRTDATDVPFIHRGQEANYPNVHPSLVHLLPLYKPLGREFDYGRPDSRETERQTRTNNLGQNSRQRNIESELHPWNSTRTEPDSKSIHLANEHNSSQDPDVSINVLEVPRITKEFENVKVNESYDPVPQPENARGFHNSVENYPSVSQTYFKNAPHFQRSNAHGENIFRSGYGPLPLDAKENSAGKEIYLNKSSFHIPPTDVSTTTILPILTTPEHPVTDRTTSNTIYVPSVHTAFQNSEDFNSFQIFPSYVQNNDASSLQRNLTAQFVHSSNTKFTDESIAHNAFVTTEYPLTGEKYRTKTNHRSDIPSEDSDDRFPPPDHGVDVASNTYPLFVNNATNEGVPPYRIRYQSALRDFKPDEIVIDIENIPTHTLPPVTSSFQQRIPTTIQPTVKLRPSDVVRSDTSRRSEQVSGTTLRSLYPTTRYPRRRINDKTRRPVQNGSISYHPKGSLNQNYHQAIKPQAQINQLIGVNHYNPAHNANRRQFHHPNRPHPPSQVRMPTEMNQLHHFSQLNNLPPGVSMHPRHPQAPFAEMVHSNRPPTMPLVDDSQSSLKPHRQRHHRKKDRVINSCCRLRGKTGAFQSCCRNGGPCCSRPQRRMLSPGSSCCSSSKVIGQVIPANQIQTPVRTPIKISPPIRTEGVPRSDTGNKDRCEKEKMCRTLYESTQQVMVCRNAHIEGC